MSEVAEALEMNDRLPSSATVLLHRWRKEMASLKTPTRKHLLHHLTNIGGLQDLVHRLVNTCTVKPLFPGCLGIRGCP